MRTHWLVALASLTLSGAVGAQTPSAPAAASGAPAAASGAPAAARVPGHPMAAPQEAPVDTSEPAEDLPVGTIEVFIVGGDKQPIGGIEVRLGILSQKISEGETRSLKTARTDGEGRARFDGLGTSLNFSYRVTVKKDGAEYASAPQNLRDTAGQRMRMHVYPATSSLDQALIGAKGFLYVETRDEIFQVEAMFRIINLGKTAWVPDDVLISLPEGWKAFSTSESMFDSRFEAVDGKGVALRGTFPPGQRDVSFRFQVPKPPVSSISFQVGAPPRLVEMRVIAVASRNMILEAAPGFDTPREDVTERGDRVLVTHWQHERGGSPLRSFSVTLSGLRVPSSGRWVAVGISVMFGAIGFAAARGKLRIASAERVKSDHARARELLLSELVTLEKLKAKREVGPTAYDEAHRTLLDALARIGVPESKKKAPQPQVSA